jgi:PAS domain S-box-containing protein
VGLARDGGDDQLRFIRDVVKSCDDAIISRKLDGTIVTWNPAARRIYGYSAREMVGRSILKIVPPERRSESRKIMTAIRRGRRIDHVEVLARRKDGRRIPLVLTISPVRNGSGNPIGASIIARDISQTRRAEARIRYERDLAERYLEIAEVIILVLDPRGRVVLLNRKGYQLMGYPRKERDLVNRDWFAACVPRRLRRRMRDAFQTILTVKAERSTYTESPILTQTGKERLIAWRCTPLADENGKIVGTLSSGEDITDRRLAEQALQQTSARMLRVRDEERRRIARELHDSTAQRLALLITQLGHAQRLSDQSSGAPNRLLASARSVARQALREVRSLSYLLHPPLLEEMGLASALRAHVAYLQKTRGTRIRLDLPARLERFPRPVELSAFRIVQEALNNVIRHSRSPSARVQLTREPASLVVKVVDRGRGFPRRLASLPQPHAGGAGMGFASMRERVNLAGGHLDFRTGKSGTTVTAVIPLPRKPREEKDPHSVRRRPRRAPPRHS